MSGRYQRVLQAVADTLEVFAQDIDNDEGLRSINLQVKIAKDDSVRAVVIQRESEVVPRP